MNEPLSAPFRVIVVGGGVAGLTAAHALSKAHIDHIVLERGSDPAPPAGASIAIYPHGARILHQIGCLQAAKDSCVSMEGFVNRMPDGRAIVDSKFFEYVKENHGQDVLLLERRAFLQLLWDCLSDTDKSHVRFNAKVIDIEERVDEIQVKLADGTVERGDIVLGCDGVHSLVRELMWKKANTSQPGLITAREKTSISTHWTALIGVGPPAPEMGNRTMTCVHNKGYSFLILTQPNKVFFFVFFRLPRAFTWPTRKSFTPADADSVAASIADHPVSKTMVFGEIWAQRTRGSLISIEEGILEHWHFGRIVLAGDAVHKVTPNIALGGNSSMESIILLTNHLNRCLTHHAGARPSRHTLGALFAAYQRERVPRMTEILKFSTLLTKLQAWDGALMRVFATWVLPYQQDRKVADQLGEIIRTASRLDFVDVGEGFERGRIGWADEEEDKGKGEKRNMGKVEKVRKGGKMRWESQILQLLGAMSALIGFVWLMAFHS